MDSSPPGKKITVCFSGKVGLWNLDLDYSVRHKEIRKTFFFPPSNHFLDSSCSMLKWLLLMTLTTFSYTIKHSRRDEYILKQ